MKVGNADLGECEKCGGIWVDGRTFEKIVAEKEEQSLVLSAALPGFGPKTAKAQKDRYWPCPVCHQLMNRVNFAHISGVVLDACRAHGVWFEQDELRQLVEFIRSGGLDRARAREKAEAAPTVPLGHESLRWVFKEENDDWGGTLSGALKVLDWLVRGR